MIGSFRKLHMKILFFFIKCDNFKKINFYVYGYALQHCSSIQNLSLNPFKNSNSLLICIAMFMCTLVICYNLVKKFTAGTLAVLVSGADYRVTLCDLCRCVGSVCGSECMDRLVPHHRCWCCCFSSHRCYYCHQSAPNTQPKLLP